MLPAQVVFWQRRSETHEIRDEKGETRIERTARQSPPVAGGGCRARFWNRLDALITAG
jgi:hypothetical protein